MGVIRKTKERRVRKIRGQKKKLTNTTFKRQMKKQRLMELDIKRRERKNIVNENEEETDKPERSRGKYAEKRGEAGRTEEKKEEWNKVS